MIKKLIRPLAVAAIVVAGLAACDGENLFEGNTGRGNGPPRVTQLSAPQQASERARVDVRVKAIAPRGLSRITVRFRGAMSEDKVLEVTPVSADTVTFDASVDLPEVLADSVLRVEAFATDVTGAVSEIVGGSVKIVDSSGPNVTVTASSTQASAGGLYELQVKAVDPFGISQIGYAFVNAQKDTVLSSLVPSNGTSRDTVFKILLPASLPVADLTVIGIAVNAANLRGVSSPLAVSLIDELNPSAQIIEPGEGESFPLRDSIRVRVHAQDGSGIRRIAFRGVAFRFFPDSSQNSFPVVRFPEVVVPLPQGPDRPATTDTTVFRWLKPGADTTSEAIYIIAEVEDLLGNIGVDTVRIIPGPRVSILNPATGSSARINSSLPVRVSAYDPQAGLDSLKVYITGAIQDSFIYKPLGGTRDPIERNILLNVPGSDGTISMRAFVWNAQGIGGSTSQPVLVNVSSQATSAPPRVLRSVAVASRVELDDSIRIRVVATDDGGITRLGAVAIVVPQNEGPGIPRDTFYFSSPVLNPPQGGTPDATFTLQLRDTYKEVGAARFPMGFTIQVHAFAIDSDGSCSASVNEFEQQLACTPAGPNHFLAAGQTGKVYNPVGVVGTSVLLPPNSIIADALPDTANQRVYLSNLSNNRVDVLELVDTVFRSTPILVGSEPWGMFLVPGGTDVDTLMVGNSGGTNISFVPALPGRNTPLREDGPRRLLVPNEVLFEISETTANGLFRYSVRKLEFSDRPQFVAQDRNKVILYSTKPTSAAIEGTARMAITDATPGDPTDAVRPESKILFGRDAVGPGNSYAVARVDSIAVIFGQTGDDQIVVFDHVDGFPNQVITSVGYAFTALPFMADSTASDIFFDRGGWIRENVGFSDTTYVAYSKDLSTIAFGEGATQPTGRIFLWAAAASPLTPGAGRVSTHGTLDLIGNAAEVVRGVALNANGTLGVARGAQQTYFFTNSVQGEGELRLNGVFSSGVAGGNGGVALHPHHTYISQSNETSLAFVATNVRTIKVIDTFHYFEVGEIPIRDNIVGQLRAVPPPPGSNAGLAVTSCDYTVAQLFGVTNTNNLVIVNVRRKDLLKDPNRTCTQ